MRIRRGPAIWMGVMIACAGAAGVRVVDIARSDDSVSSDSVSAQSSIAISPFVAPDTAITASAQHEQTCALSLLRTMAARR
jgi:hypothetical protein